MNKRTVIIGCAVGAALTAGFFVGQSNAAKDHEKSHPTIITPSGVNTLAPPSDAIVLFDGSNYDAWVGRGGNEVKWKIEEGNMVVTKTGVIHTKQEFGDIQLHLEFATPNEVKGNGQGRGNSGVYFQGRYEIQVLDSFENETYPMGQCAAIYEVSPPMVNASRKPGQWQSYDIIFRAPKFDESGNVIEKARMTAFHNGVLVQDNVEVPKPTRAAMFGDIKPTGPIMLQDHGNPVRYRNIWVRELK